MNERILILSDTHIPYHHPDLIPFLKACKKKYRPDRVISIGDEIDNHAISFHDSDPDLPSAGDELDESIAVIQEIEKLFPKVDILESNHGSLLYRRASSHGIPHRMLKNYNEILEVGPGWKWHRELCIKLPNGQPVYFTHGKNANVTILSKNMGMSAVQGHYHGRFKIEYWGNPERLNWAMSVGCLVDDDSLALAYNKNVLERPIIGCGAIVNSQPLLIPLVKKRNARWVGEL